MRRKLFIIVSAAIAVLSMLFCFSACGKGNIRTDDNSGGNGGSGDNGGNDNTHTVHSYIVTVVEPTCTEQGYTLHKCACGDEYRDNYTTAAHDFSEFYSSSGCNAQEDYIFRICRKCEYLETNVEVVHPHEYEFMEPIDPTCTDCGVSVWVKCKNCDYVPMRTYIRPLGHDFGNRYYDNTSNHYRVCMRDDCGSRVYGEHRYTRYEVVRAATCTTEGEMVAVCADCGHRSTVVLEPHHRWNSGTVIEAPTCTQSGSGRYVCMVCSETTIMSIPALGHAWGECTVITEPTCTTDGVGRYECKRCGETKTEPLESGHKFGEWIVTKEPSCTVYGERERICSACGEKEIRRIRPRHSYDGGITITEPTCTETGSVLYTCRLCGCSEIVETPALGHNGKETVVEPTCTEAGYTATVCSRCGELLSKLDDSLPLGHELEYDSDEHEHWQVCTRDGCDYQGEKGEHTVELCVTTEEKNGEFLHKLADACSTCGYEENVRQIVHEHRAVELIEATATCTQPGLSEGLKCGVACCDEILIHPTDVDALGHWFVNGVCLRCGESYFDANQTEGLEYTINEAGRSYSCTGIGTATDTDIIIASTHNGLPVVSIGMRAFKDKRITSVEIPDSVLRIGINAFALCYNLDSIKIPNGVVIELGAFVDTAYFENKNNWENDVLYLDKYLIATKNTKEHYAIKDGTLAVANNAFVGCRSLTSIEIPNSLTSIGDNAFDNCRNLEEIIIGNNALTIGHNAFAGTAYYNNASNWTDNVLYIGNNLVEAKDSLSGGYTIKSGTLTISWQAFSGCRSLTSITIPNSVTSIGDEAFANCSSLTSITIPNSVMSIGSYAFGGCSNLTSITISNSVTSIGSHAFGDCRSLTRITVESGNTKYYSSGNCLIETESKTLIVGCNSSITIPNSVTSIGERAFEYCNNLTSITIPNSVTSIGGRAFSNCSSITSVTIPNSVTSIGYEAFRDCDSLTSIEIPNSVTSIGEGAFSGCSSLTSITIPNSVTSIGGSAFYDCRSLQYNEYENGLYLGNEQNKYLVLIKAKNKSITSCTIHQNTRFVPGNAFDGCSSLTSITIPNSVMSIGSYVFDGCSSLTSITIPAGLTSIGDSAFRGCSSLTSITIPAGLTSIGDSAFGGCSNLTSITIPNSVTSIGGYAFSGCSSLTSITIPSSVTSIGWFAFESCSSLTIYCQAASSSRGWHSYWNHSSRPVVWDCRNNDKDRAGYAYSVIDGIKFSLKDGVATVIRQPSNISGNIAIPSSVTYKNETYSVTSIGQSAFYNCRDLTSITIPNSVTSIGSYVFDGCSSLTSITIPNGVTSIGLGAFRGCSRLTIYCEAAEKPDGWDSRWNSSDCPVVWGYKNS